MDIFRTIFKFYEKIKEKLHSIVIRNSVHKAYYFFLYKSFWHYKLTRKDSLCKPINAYFTARPNPGAGIGHQMANWIAGYWFAKQFSLPFAHIPFSNQNWENFLGFGDGIPSVRELSKRHGYKKIRLPLFDEKNEKEVKQIQQIIHSYKDQKIIFIAEQDQFYQNQFGVQEEIKNKFYHAKAREKDKLIYSKSNFNIAIHIRRGDIGTKKPKQNPNLSMRWQNNDYFVNVLANVIRQIETEKNIAIFLFSQGKESDFKEFAQFENVQFCLDMNARESFLHMVYADLLITSKSSFSYKPALLNNGIKISPKDFWHRYPFSSNWILADEMGNFNLDN